MKILVLGGTVFVGRHVVDAALKAGHDVTMFTRGKTNPSLFPQAEHLRGDRDGQLDALKGRKWDAVIDPSGYVPRIVRQSADLLKDAVGQYVFVSTISVYPDYSRPVDENSPTAPLTDPKSEDVAAHYGALKAACERALDEVYGKRVTHVRCGLIVGPDDPTNRFTYWPDRIAAGGTVLAPGKPSDPFQVIDVRDLANFLLLLAEKGLGGPVNATGPAARLSLGDAISRMATALNPKCDFVWIDDETLVAEGVGPWMELPMWMPGPMKGIFDAVVTHGVAHGLKFRPLEETAKDTHAWSLTAGPQRPTLTREKEQAIIAKHAKR